MTPFSFSQDRLDRIAAMERWHFWFAGRTALLRRLLARQPEQPGQRILDVGCGTGHTLDLLGALGHDPIGIDRRGEGLARRRQHIPDARLVQGDAHALPFGAATMDGATLLDVLEHVDDAALLSEVRRVLRPGGLLVLTVPAMPWLWSLRDEAAGHLRRYTRRGLVQLLETAGFQVRTLVYYQFFLFPLLAATRILGRNSRHASTAEETPSPVINRLLTAVNRTEAWLGQYLRWPWGSSLVAVCTLKE